MKYGLPRETRRPRGRLGPILVSRGGYYKSMGAIAGSPFMA